MAVVGDRDVQQSAQQGGSLHTPTSDHSTQLITASPTILLISHHSFATVCHDDDVLELGGGCSSRSSRAPGSPSARHRQAPSSLLSLSLSVRPSVTKLGNACLDSVGQAYYLSWAAPARRLIADAAPPLLLEPTDSAPSPLPNVKESHRGTSSGGSFSELPH